MAVILFEEGMGIPVIKFYHILRSQNKTTDQLAKSARDLDQGLIILNGVRKDQSLP